ncbi:hemerythrin domain-containing protein [Sulfitobacter guttiformis]|uniref:Hemerythrin HHE cation binding domain-containing protein n=1 Tax=Sulfitobacter guttiformis TaxID=74349 RepID=A0A420DJI7_9RHOB|nr:hemerythrin domain-containing protein [Sulfitobacter guttiformis]KIN71816.1 hypothetical protein Z949_980 [Sulfitobacter guttiformis KCTC 32187]RKE94368.1 hemerythrin HHE cation binding domain-containing protein [Sulfitobacter guttiformis]
MQQPLQSSHLIGLRDFGVCLEEQFDLCVKLEDLADSLPSKVDTRVAMMLARRLQSALRRCHALEEKIVFPVLLSAQTDIAAILDRLRQEHLEDEYHANDVYDAIQAYVATRDRKDAEQLGYMLRCLFISLRRHLAFDCDYVLPLLRRAAVL